MTRLNQVRRQSIGHIYKPQVNNNVTSRQTGRQMSYIQNQAFTLNALQGTGFGTNLIRGVVPIVGAFGLKKLSESSFGTKLKNIIPASDDTARASFPGESHMVLKLKNGKNGIANFMGPGTRAIERVKRGDPGRTASDKVAKMHDINYFLAADSKNKSEQFAKVRRADNRMLNSLKQIKKNRSDAGRNTSAGLRLIQLKKKAENKGLIGKQAFAGPLSKLTPNERNVLMAEKSRLMQKGLGALHVAESLPGDKLKQKLLKQMIREKKLKSLGDRVKTSPIAAGGQGGVEQIGGNIVVAGSKPSESRGQDLGKSYIMKGSGKKDIFKFVMVKILPKLMKDLGIKSIKKNKLAPMIKKILTKSTKTPKILISNLSKVILPALIRGKVQMIKKGKGLIGRGIIDKLKTAKNALHKKLASGLWDAFKFYLSKKQKGGGLSLAGSGFWKSFVKGFKSVFKPAASILGPVATALGVPQLGIPLTIAGKLL